MRFSRFLVVFGVVRGLEWSEDWSGPRTGVDRGVVEHVKAIVRSATG